MALYEVVFEKHFLVLDLSTETKGYKDNRTINSKMISTGIILETR